jgi:hypothetical protein
VFFIPAAVVLGVGAVKLRASGPESWREVSPVMTRYLNGDRIAILAALAAPLAAAAILLPFRASWSNTNVAMLHGARRS